MSKLPDGWKHGTLSDVAAKQYGLVDGPFGSNLKASEYISIGIPIIRGGNLSTGATKFKDYGFVFVSQSKADELIRSNCYPLDILFTKKGTLGQTGIIPPDANYERYLLSSNQMKLTIEQSSADPYFVYYWVSSETAVAKILNDATSTGVPQINLGYLRDFPILLPPLPEQRAIAAILSTWDDAITLTKALIEALQHRKQALMQLLLTGEVRFQEFEGDEWEEIRLGDLVTIFSGESPSNFDLKKQGKYPFIKVEDLNNNRKYQHGSRQYSDSARKTTPSQSVIFPKRGAAILNNKVRLLSVPALMDSNMMALFPDRDRVKSEYLYYLMLQEKLYKIADTSTIPQINNKHIEPYTITLPEVSEQEKIADILRYCDDEIDFLTQYHGNLIIQKSALMQQVLTGAIRVQGLE